MGVELSEEKIWRAVAEAPTGIVTTLRQDGWPVALPVWFAVLAGEIYFRSPATSKKVARIQRDPRASFLVESGENWRELRAVSLSATATVVSDLDLVEQALAALARKYDGRRQSRSTLPEATVRHYEHGGTAVIRLHPVGRPISWDNRRIAPKAPS
ncbi:MAG TPA: pyridoxamine 5'-phosphate oxidase family protein [Acidimicrobiales bacterium]|jgi:PPOX class probable F420-dependent enzyme|nr:pyridoxamine 5'-phosphate oxidase family protein [Acidimicrobiales bacterium]